MCQPLSPEGEPNGDPIRVKLSFRRNGDLPNRLRFTRSFGYPGRIDDFERVWLTFDGWHGVVSIQLNGNNLVRNRVTESGFESDVTPILRQHNKLQVELNDDTDASWRTGETALEIRCTAYLRDVQATWKLDELRVNGCIVGQCDQPLDLYLLYCGQNLGYDEVTAFDGEKRFAFTIPDCPMSPKKIDSIRLELVNASTVWYVVEATVDSETT